MAGAWFPLNKISGLSIVNEKIGVSPMQLPDTEGLDQKRIMNLQEYGLGV